MTQRILSFFVGILRTLMDGIERSAYLKAIYELERMGMQEQAASLKKEYQNRFKS